MPNAGKKAAPGMTWGRNGPNIRCLTVRVRSHSAFGVVLLSNIGVAYGSDCGIGVWAAG